MSLISDILLLCSTDVLKQLNYNLLASYANDDPPYKVPPTNHPVMVLNNKIPWRGCVEKPAKKIRKDRVQVAIWDIGVTVEVNLKDIRLIGSNLTDGRFMMSSMADQMKVLTREAAFCRHVVKTDTAKGLRRLDGLWNEFSMRQDGKLTFSDNDDQVKIKFQSASIGHARP